MHCKQTTLVALTGADAVLFSGKIGRVLRTYQTTARTGKPEKMVVVRFSKRKVKAVPASYVKEYRFDLG